MPSSFFNHGVLGINARNLLYVKPFNPKKAIALADDKLKTKAFLTARGIPAAKIYARIESRDQLRQFDFSQLPDECVLKPNYGFGGEGILVLKGRKNGKFLKGKEPMDERDLRAHIEDIIDGKFSLGGRVDTAFFEQLLVPHNCFARFRPVGLPDLRIIVFNLVPIMAMLRIPTAASQGKANLHLGGIGIGVDIAKGITTHAAQYHGSVSKLPHGESPSGIEIPYWDEILLICSRIQYITNIGYLAVDITIDENMGPAILEVNARAGLNVQVANLAPLRSRLERVQGLTVSSPEKGVSIGQDLFGGEKAERKTSKVPDKPVLGTRETIVIQVEGATIQVPARIATEETRTVFSPDLVEELKKKKAVQQEEGKEETYKVKFSLAEKKIQTLVKVGDTGNVRAIIGRRDLADFLIDPSKTEHSVPTTSSTKTVLKAADRMLSTIDKELLLLKQLKPVNIAEERERIVEDDRYNPVFSYPELSFDSEEFREKLSQPIEDSSPLGRLFEKKRIELIARLDLLDARGDAEAFTKASINLYGQPSSGLLRSASAYLHNQQDIDVQEEKAMSAQDAATLFEEVLHGYSLHDWDVQLRERLMSDCAVGGNHIYLRTGARFTKTHVDSLVAHEIETHVLTAENGDHQPYALFRRGFADYLDTQEGLAIYNQNRVLPDGHEKRLGSSRSVLGLAFGLENSFADLRAYLQEELGYNPEKAITKALDIKRGIGDTSEAGAFTKGVVYYRGLRAVEKFVEAGGDLRRLYVGKIALEDLDLIEQIPDLQPPLLVPTFLRSE